MTLDLAEKQNPPEGLVLVQDFAPVFCPQRWWTNMLLTILRKLQVKDGCAGVT
jgi:hypothetical protein